MQDQSPVYNLNELPNKTESSLNLNFIEHQKRKEISNLNSIKSSQIKAFSNPNPVDSKATEQHSNITSINPPKAGTLPEDNKANPIQINKGKTKDFSELNSVEDRSEDKSKVANQVSCKIPMTELTVNDTIDNPHTPYEDWEFDESEDESNSLRNSSLPHKKIKLNIQDSEEDIENSEKANEECNGVVPETKYGRYIIKAEHL